MPIGVDISDDSTLYTLSKEMMLFRNTIPYTWSHASVKMNAGKNPIMVISIDAEPISSQTQICIRTYVCTYMCIENTD